MIERLRSRPAILRPLSRVERPDALVLAIILAGIAAAGWLASPFWLAVAIGAQLALGGLAAVWIIGPAKVGLGFARYATLAATGVAVTLFGRLLVDSAGLLLVPVAAALLWSVLWVELRIDRTEHVDIGLDLCMVATVFAAAAGVGSIVAPTDWPPGLVLTLLIVLVPALRSAEGRGRSGMGAVGQAALHLLAVAQVAAAVALLGLPGVVGAAVVALAFHAWTGAAEALEGGASARAVVLEFGALALVGVAVSVLLSLR